MRTKTFILNAIFSALLQIVILGTGLILPRAYLMIYGSEINGLIISITQIVSYFNLAEAGLGAALIYALYKPLAEKKYDEINEIVSSGKKYYLKTSYIYMGLVIILSILYPLIIKDNNINSITIILLVLIIGFSGALEFFTMSKYRVLLTADQKLYVIYIASISSILINLIIILTLSSLNVDIILLKIVALSSFLVRSLIFNLYLKRKYPKVNFNGKSIKIKKKMRMEALIHELSKSTHVSIPIIIITFLCPLKTVSIYAIYSMVFIGIMGLLNIISPTASSIFGNIIAKKENETLIKVFDEYELTLYTFINWIYSCSFILIMPFIKIYTVGINDANYFNNTYGMLFVLWGVVNTTWIAREILIVATGKFGMMIKADLIQMVGLISIGFLLTKSYGITGMLIALVISASIRMGLVIYHTNKEIISGHLLKTIYRLLRIPIIFVVVSLPFKSMIVIDINNLSGWIGYAFIVSAYSAAVNIIFIAIFDGNTFKQLVLRGQILLEGIKEKNNS